MTISLRRAIVASLCIAGSASWLAAQRPPDYRTYRMGDDATAVVRQSDQPSPASSGAVVLGPVSELRWRAQYKRLGAAPTSDPVESLTFSFFEDRLFRIVIDYAPERTEGMTEADLVAAVSKVYGPPAKRADATSAGPSERSHADTVVAQWTDGERQVALLAVGGRSAYRMVVASVPIEALARRAGALEAPADVADGFATEAARTNARVEKVGTASEKRRRANLAVFMP